MTTIERQAHWDHVYQSKDEQEVSWFQDSAEPSLGLIAQCGGGPNSGIIDIGGGASRLVDTLLEQGYTDVSVLDLSPAALEVAKQRLGSASAKAAWIAADVTQWNPARTYDIWHDRAAFHFLTSPDEQAAYITTLTKTLRRGAHAIIGTFAPDGPEKCSGLTVARHDSASLSRILGDTFQLVHQRAHEHVTPWQSVQKFQFSVFRLS